MIAFHEPNVLSLEGEIDLHESPRVREELSAAIERKPRQMLVDLSGLTYIDSSGIAVLIEALQRMQSYGGKLLLCGVRDNVKQMFEIARLDTIFAMFPDTRAALKAA